MIFKHKGVLGINARNLLYIRPYNRKKAIKLADDKIKTKQFLAARDVPVPKLFGSIRTSDELKKFDFTTLPSSFVIKPNHGYGGEGIIPIVEKKGDKWVTAGGRELTMQDIEEHINDIIDGRYSISNISDTAFFEQYIISDDILAKYSYEGLPDIRVVVHNLIPVMAMLRLPTKESEGKANLHLGAVGVGIDIAKGEATHISYKNKIIDELPENLGTIRGLKIPYWDEILLTASKVQSITNLGYMAIDISIDKYSGPVLLEINARAGLGVQIANLAPLRRRLERIQGVKVTNPIKGVRIAKDMFGNTIEKEIEHLSGKEVIGQEEEIELIQKKGVYKILAKIDTGRERSIIDRSIVEKAKLFEENKNNDEKSTLKLKFNIKKQRIQTIVDIADIDEKEYKMIIGSRDLSNFLIDTTMKKQGKNASTKKIETIEENTPIIKRKDNYHLIDQQLNQIDSQLKLLYHLRPLNLIEEKQKFFANPSSNPQFEYARLKFNSLDLVDKLNKIEITDQNSELGAIFQAKKIEISQKIALIESMDESRFTEISTKLFSKPSEEDYLTAIQLLKNTTNQTELTTGQTFNAQEVKQRFEEVFKSYGLKNWKVKIKENMVATCIAGKSNRLFIRKDIRFTEKRIQSLIVHEIETHILTAENGKKQPYNILNRGLSGYLTTQEGMAMFNVETQEGLPFKNNKRALTNLIATYRALTSSFSETYNFLLELGVDQDQAFGSTLKAKRGFYDTEKKGAFTKSYVYFKGYKEVKQYIKDGGSLEDLYMGKMNISDVERVKKIDGIKKPSILPKWLKE